MLNPCLTPSSCCNTDSTPTTQPTLPRLLQPNIHITVEVLHLVFSAFGFVHKLATFEKAAGFQALVQYGDSETADQVRQALDGRHIPRHVLNDTPNPPMLKLSFSQHTDLNVKFQSHRSR